MTLGEVATTSRARGFRAAFWFYRAHFRSVLELSIVFYVGIAALAVLSVAELGPVVAFAITLPYLAIISIFWLQAPLARLMNDVRDGRRPAGVRRTFAELSPRMGSITGGSLLGSACVLLGLYLFVVPGMLLLARWALLIPVVVIENRRAFSAFGRSNALVRGHTWRVVGELLVSTVIAFVIAVVGLGLLAIGSWFGVVAALLFIALAIPPIPLMRTLSYFDLRDRFAGA